MPPAWAQRARQPSCEKGEDPVTVLVTGFGPFLARFPHNSSWEIASTLPSLLLPTPTSPTPIHIHVHHEAVRVAYNSVTSLIPALLPPSNPMTPAPDIVLHIGLAAGRTFYTLEKGAHGRGYGTIPDVDEVKFDDDQSSQRWPPDRFPAQLETLAHTDDVVSRWKTELGYSAPHVPQTCVDGEAGQAPVSPSTEGDCSTRDAHAQLANASANAASNARKQSSLPDVRLSPDAGNYLCGFIYYNSLAHYYQLGEQDRLVTFLHVPDLSESKEKLDTGREVAVALIRALVESRRKVGIGRADEVAEDNKEGAMGAGTDVNFIA